jgi:hypothetical protein
MTDQDFTEDFKIFRECSDMSILIIGDMLNIVKSQNPEMIDMEIEDVISETLKLFDKFSKLTKCAPRTSIGDYDTVLREPIYLNAMMTFLSGCGMQYLELLRTMIPLLYTNKEFRNIMQNIVDTKDRKAVQTFMETYIGG